MTNSATPNFTDDEVGNILRMKEKIQDLIKMHGIFEVVEITSEGEFFTQTMNVSANQLVIAGGIFTSLFHDEPIKDIDVFILKPGMTPAITLFNRLIKYKEGNWNIKYRFNEEDDYYNPHVFGVADHVESKVQYILTDHTNRQDLLKDFDFIHSTVSYHEGKLHINRETYDAIANKKLIRQNLKKEPKKTRVMKFLNKGFARIGEDVSKTKTKALLEMWEQALKESAYTLPGPMGPAHIRPNGRIDQVTESKWDNIFDDALKSDALKWQKNNTPFTFDMTIRDKTKIV